MQAATALDSRGLAARVAEIVRERVPAGELRPGEHLNESTLATELGVGHATVRAGLHRLKPEGLVDSHEDLAEIYAMHQPLVEAILAGNAHGAEEIARSHNTEDGEALGAQLSATTDALDDRGVEAG